MAAIKLVLFLCIAVFYTYARVPDFHQQYLLNKLKDAKSDALENLDLLRGSIEGAINGAMVTINDSLELLNNAVQAVMADVKENLDATIEPFLNAIEELEDEAAEVDVDITECVGNSTDDITALPIEFLNEITSCMNLRLAETEEYVNQTIQTMVNTFNIITDLNDQIYVCGNETQQQTQCFDELELKIADLRGNLPVRILVDAYNVRVYVYQVIPQIALCTAGVIDDLEDQGAAIVANVTACALEKINGTTTK